MGTMERREPTRMQKFNTWLLPIMAGCFFTSLVAVLGYLGDKTFVSGTNLSTVKANQTTVMANQKKLMDKVDVMDHKIDLHLEQTGVNTKSNSRIHHRGNVSPCNQCHLSLNEERAPGSRGPSGKLNVRDCPRYPSSPPTLQGLTDSPGAPSPDRPVPSGSEAEVQAVASLPPPPSREP